MKRILLCSIGLLLFQNLNAQTQIGSTINGVNNYDEFGYSVDISSNGNRVIIGSLDNMTITTEKGYARVYEKNGAGNWVNLGGDVLETQLGDRGGVVSISGDGTKIAIGSQLHDAGLTNNGETRIMYWSGTFWLPYGGFIDGEAANDFSGTSVSLSNDGNVVAIGAPGNDGNGADSGHVRVYAYNGTGWVQRGSDINGETAGDNFGSSVALSPDGSKLVVGAIYNDGSASNAGHVRVFTWNGTTWIQKGTDIDGTVANQYFGYSVDISNDGNRIVVGAPYHDGTITDQGLAKVFNYTSSWTQIGQNLLGSTTNVGSLGTSLGSSVSISGDGNVIAVGSRGFTDSVDTRGLTEVYKLISTTWTQVGNDLIGNGMGNQFGYSVALSNDGLKVISGAPYFGITRYAKVYDYTVLLSSTNFQLNESFSIHPNPVTNQFYINSDFEIDSVEVINLQGQVVKRFENQDSYNINDLSAGIYMVMIQNQEGKGVKKIIKQ